MPDKVVRTLRSTLWRFATNEALFLFFAFLFVSSSVFSMDPLLWYQEGIVTFTSCFIVPWGGALCLLRLDRRVREGDARPRADMATLFMLLLWLVFPFAIRFGLTAANVYSWFNHTVLFFGLYALVSDSDRAHLDRVVDLASALFAALSFVLAAAALYCAATVQSFGVEAAAVIDGDPFGLTKQSFLTFGLHYNDSAMLAVCCALMSLLGVARRKHLLSRLLHLIPSVMMMIVVVLTQSRTSRYALLGALAAGCYGLLASRLRVRRAALRHAAALACAIVVLAAGYLLSDALNDAALRHYTSVRAERLSAQTAAPGSSALVQVAVAQDDDSPAGAPDETGAQDAPAADAAEDAAPDAEETAALTAGDSVQPAAETPEPTAEPTPVPELETRPAIDSTFSERTIIWKNLVDFWRENPKYLIIGNGMHRTGSMLVEGTKNHVDAIATHNAYLQFIADYGLIGFALLVLFLLTVARRALRVFFAPAGAYPPGCRVFVMIAVSQLLTGLMESTPLKALSAPSLVFFFALAALYAYGDRKTAR